MRRLKYLLFIISIFYLCISAAYADNTLERYNRDSNITLERDLNNDGKNDISIEIIRSQKVLIKNGDKIMLSKSGANYNDFFECTISDFNHDGNKDIMLLTVDNKSKRIYFNIYLMQKDELIKQTGIYKSFGDYNIETSYILSSDINKNGLMETVLIMRDKKTNLIRNWSVLEVVKGQIKEILTEDLSKDNIIQIKISDEGQIIKKKIFFEGSSPIPTSYIKMYFQFSNGKYVLANKENAQEYYNIEDSQINNYIKKVSIEEGVPYEILKAISQKESRSRQFDYGEPLVSYDGGIGIMQVTPYLGRVEIKYLNQNLSDKDIERLKYDAEYNIRIGARILYDKWRSSFASAPAIPKISDMNPQILDNWYFSVMAYNGYAIQNLPKDNWGQAYQEQVFSFIEGFNKDNFDKDKIYAHGADADGLPMRSKIYALTGSTMKSSGTGFEIKANDIMAVSVSGTKLRSTPEITNDNVTIKLAAGDIVEVIEKAGFSSGYEWYKVKIMGSDTQGYIAGILLKYLYDDITLHWARIDISQLAAKGITDPKTVSNFEPGINITRGDFCKLIIKALKLELKPFQGKFTDVYEDDQNALYIEAASYAGIMNGTGLSGFNPDKNITREEIAAIMMRTYRLIISNSSIVEAGSMDYQDAEEVSDWAKSDVSMIKGLNVMTGIIKHSKLYFMPKANTSRGEAAVIVNRFMGTWQL